MKATREKQIVTYKGVPIRLSADFSKETLQAKGVWHEVFKVTKSRDLQPRLLYLMRTLACSVRGVVAETGQVHMDYRVLWRKRDGTATLSMG